ncbi:MAG: hypothetical protein GXP26_02500 [Planctomycetes bacterium]|nr:hypothetical protein [Planctomycetota bacterium]
MNDVESRIQAFFEEHTSLLSFLDENSQPSFHSTVDSMFAKTLLLSIASAFETQISEILLGFVSHASNNNNMVVTLVKQKAVDRQYHTLFAWDSNNANKFFKLFGEGFTTFAKQALENDQQLLDGVKRFMELGRLRNELVHRNFLAYTLNDTAEEIIQKYESAQQFVGWIPNALEQVCKTDASPSNY